MKKMILKPELVPQTSWGANLRSMLKTADWDTLRHIQYNLAKGVCEICGAKGKDQGYRWDLECHEVWDYNDVSHQQTLVRLIALCPACHACIHFGHTQLVGRGDQAIKHMMAVNHCTEREAHLLIGEAQAKWVERSGHGWNVDVSWLEEHGVAVPVKTKKRTTSKKSHRKK